MTEGLRVLLWFPSMETGFLGERGLPGPPSARAIDEYALSRRNQNPSCTLLATASGDSETDVAMFYRRLVRRTHRLKDLSITRFGYPQPEAIIRGSDILMLSAGAALTYVLSGSPTTWMGRSTRRSKPAP